MNIIFSHFVPAVIGGGLFILGRGTERGNEYRETGGGWFSVFIDDFHKGHASTIAYMR